MASKLKLQPSPTFTCTVESPVPGAESVPVVFEFKHYSVSGIEEFWQEAMGRPDLESAALLVVGWDLEDEFTADNLHSLLNNYPGSAVALINAYSTELWRARRGN